MWNYWYVKNVTWLITYYYTREFSFPVLSKMKWSTCQHADHMPYVLPHFIIFYGFTNSTRRNDINVRTWHEVVAKGRARRRCAGLRRSLFLQSFPPTFSRNHPKKTKIRSPVSIFPNKKPQWKYFQMIWIRRGTIMTTFLEEPSSWDKERLHSDDICLFKSTANVATVHVRIATPRPLLGRCSTICTKKHF